MDTFEEESQDFSRVDGLLEEDERTSETIKSIRSEERRRDNSYFRSVINKQGFINTAY
jgi:hypothetical protein